MIKTRLSLMFEITSPIILEGIDYVAGPRLVATVSESGGLGVLAAGALDPEGLKHQIQTVKEMTQKSIGISVPLNTPDVEEKFEIILEEQLKIVITSAGSPAQYTRMLKERGFRVVHEATSVEEARKAETEGADAVIARGIEAGGMDGRDEIGTAVLTPLIADAVKIPVIASGGIVDGRTLTAALALGAEGVQLGTRFAATWESDGHEKYKEAIIKCTDSGTVLVNRSERPVRLIKNNFTKHVIEMEESGIHQELGAEAFRRGMMEGDIENGALIAGQGAGLIKSIKSARDVIREMLYEIIVISDQLSKYKPVQSFMV